MVGAHFHDGERFPAMNERIKMRNGDNILAMVKDGRVIHHTWNVSLTHVEFVKRTEGELPEGAWVGTASKADGEILAISSKTFYGYQLPASSEVTAAIRMTFE